MFLGFIAQQKKGHLIKNVTKVGSGNQIRFSERQTLKIVKKIVEVSKYWLLMDVLRLLKRCLVNRKGKPDGGLWYLWPAQRLWLKHMVPSKGKRKIYQTTVRDVRGRGGALNCFF